MADRGTRAILQFGIVGGLLLAVGGIALGGWGWYELNRAAASAAWPTVEGRILRSEVDVRRCACNPQMPNVAKYRATIAYEYYVDGARHVARRVSLGYNTVMSRYKSRDFSIQYAEGRKVRIHYDPADPNLAVLEAGTTRNAWIVPGMGFVLFVVGAFKALKAHGELAAESDEATVAETLVPAEGEARYRELFEMMQRGSPVPS
jgi:hypothetical protein